MCIKATFILGLVNVNNFLFLAEQYQGKLFSALFNYDGRMEGDLSFAKGDTLHVLDQE